MMAFLMLLDRRRKEEVLLTLEIQFLASQGSARSVQEQIRKMRRELR